MDSYRVPKQRAAVEVKLSSHPAEPYDVFLSPYAATHTGAQTVHDLLTQPEPFLPLLSPTRGLLLARKGSICWLRVIEPERAEWHYLEACTGVSESPVRLELADGETMPGVVRALAPEGGRRVVDVVNRTPGFLHFETEDGLLLVNLANVTTITPMEERRGDA